jgi:hypothetical protein
MINKTLQGKKKLKIKTSLSEVLIGLSEKVECTTKSTEMNHKVHSVVVISDWDLLSFWILMLLLHLEFFILKWVLGSSCFGNV